MTNKINRVVMIIMIGAVLVGLADSSFLFYKYITADPINCFLFDGCNTVAKSPYSHIFGIPLPVFGLLFYSTMALTLAISYFKNTQLVLKLLLLLGAIGFSFSLYFIYLQGFVIQAFCIYCLLSALTSTILFCSIIYIFQNSRNSGASESVV